MIKIATSRILPLMIILLFLTVFLGLGYGLSQDKYRDFFLACQVIPLLKLRFFEPVNLSQLVIIYLKKGKVQGLLESLGDPYTRYLNQKEYVQLLEENKGSYGGVGLYLEYKDGELIIFKPIKNSPAELAGLRPGDRITAIDYQSTKEMSKEIAVTKILGPPGTTLTLTIKRGEGNTQITREVTLTRTLIDPSIEWEIKKDSVVGKIGWISLTQFTEKTSSDLGQALQAIAREKAAGIVLDLRYNPGGLLISAVEVASQLLAERSNSPVVSLKYRNQQAETFTAYPNPHPPLPLVVLVNEWSASSSEIVAGAVKDLKAGVLVGNTTFGKGLVQDVLPLPTGGALYLTVATYLTAGGHSIHKTGIRPDVVVKLPNESDRFKEQSDFRALQKIDRLQAETAIQVLRKLILVKRKAAA